MSRPGFAFEGFSHRSDFDPGGVSAGRRRPFRARTPTAHQVRKPIEIGVASARIARSPSDGPNWRGVDEIETTHASHSAKPPPDEAQVPRAKRPSWEPTPPCCPAGATRRPGGGGLPSRTTSGRGDRVVMVFPRDCIRRQLIAATAAVSSSRACPACRPSRRSTGPHWAQRALPGSPTESRRFVNCWRHGRALGEATLRRTMRAEHQRRRSVWAGRLARTHVATGRSPLRAAIRPALSARRPPTGQTRSRLPRERPVPSSPASPSRATRPGGE